ncbi:unnamed protein product, partial [marine sediment metagenome]
MEGLIIVAGNAVATTADILQGTRLQTVPAGGYLTFEMQALAAGATNFMLATIQLPDGATPLNSVLIPGATADLLDDRQKLMVTFPIAQGGHCVFTLTEGGTCTCMFRVTYSP